MIKTSWTRAALRKRMYGYGFSYAFSLPATVPVLGDAEIEARLPEKNVI